MPEIPDLTNPRYLHEVGWFLFYDRYPRGHYPGSYADARREHSNALLEHILALANVDRSWLRHRTVVTIGCGCTGDLAMWPAAAKVAIDPLLYTYQQLEMLIDDAEGTAPTVYLSMSGEDLPLLDASADLVVCRNALDHVRDPANVLSEIARIGTRDGYVYISVDTGGDPTPDEPHVFSVDSATQLVRRHLEIMAQTSTPDPHSEERDSRAEFLARTRREQTPVLDRDRILEDYVRLANRASEIPSSPTRSVSKPTATRFRR